MRIEVPRASSMTDGSIYVSTAHTLQPAICRIDFLELRPDAADRMHWHSTMEYGEPGDRTFESHMPADPVGWLKSYLRELRRLLSQAGARDARAMVRDLDAVRATADEIPAAVADGLAWARTTVWPDVEHDHRGLARSREKLVWSVTAATSCGTGSGCAPSGHGNQR